MLNYVSSEMAFSYAFLLRKSFFYRSRVAKILHAFRNPPPGEKRLKASASCVAVHLRRGDRVLGLPKDINYTEYCYNSSHNLLCNGRMCDPDSGCSATNPLQPPFAAITLRHVLDKIPLVVGDDVKNVFVASDDVSWVEQQIQEVRAMDPSWNIFFLPAPNNNNNNSNSSNNSNSLDTFKTLKAKYFYMRSHGGTESGTNLMASMEIATQCEGFIGHMGCGGTSLHYEYMCIQHAGTRGICPPTYDLRNGLD